MSKVKTGFFCQNCGYESTKWSGKCPGCQQWNTFVEELIQKDTKKIQLQIGAHTMIMVLAKKTRALHEIQNSRNTTDCNPRY